MPKLALFGLQPKLFAYFSKMESQSIYGSSFELDIPQTTSN